MRKRIDFLKEDIANERPNNYGGLCLAFSLIDACAKIEYPKEKVGTRYRKWLTNYYINVQEPEPKPIKRPKLTEEEFYSTRCDFLHESKIDESDKFKGKDNKRRVVFNDDKISIGEGIFYGNNSKVKQAAHLNVNRFLKDIVFCIEQWMKTKSDEELTMFDISSSTWKTLGIGNIIGVDNSKIKIGSSGTKNS